VAAGTTRRPRLLSMCLRGGEEAEPMADFAVEDEVNTGPDSRSVPRRRECHDELLQGVAATRAGG
jgi:hypothetical protein